MTQQDGRPSSGSVEPGDGAASPTPGAGRAGQGAHAQDRSAHGSGAASKHPVTARTKARRRAVEILFEADQRGMLTVADEVSAQALREFGQRRAVFSANHTEAPAYARQIVAGVADHLASIDEAIEGHTQGWSLARMPAVDRAIARVAVWEILYNEEVDAPVAFDEAQTLAKMLSTDDSPRYLGGVLGRIAELADTLR